MSPKSPEGAREGLTHIGPDGQARMVDVGGKPVTAREAVARGFIRVSRAAMRLVRSGRLKKGPVAEVAQLAGIQAAKRTSEAIPLCHPLPFLWADVRVEPRALGFAIEARVRTAGRTGVEMEALHAVAVAALALYDMVKAADKRMVIDAIRLESKRGGSGGDFTRAR
jgi:cyclic pyranopterin phosphate synthase